MFYLCVCYEIVCFNGHTRELSMPFRLLRICLVASSTHSYRTLSPKVLPISVHKLWELTWSFCCFSAVSYRWPVRTHFLAEPVFEWVYLVCRFPRTPSYKFCLVHDYALHRLFMARARRKYIILTSRAVSDASAIKV